MHKPITYIIESAIHAIVHFLGLIVLFWFAIVPPLGISYIVLLLEIVHMKLLGNCILTKIAHKRGIMTGMSYWQYLPYVFKIKDYKKAGYYIDLVLKICIVGILLFRTIQYYLSG